MIVSMLRFLPRARNGAMQSATMKVGEEERENGVPRTSIDTAENTCKRRRRQAAQTKSLSGTSNWYASGNNDRQPWGTQKDLGGRRRRRRRQKQRQSNVESSSCSSSCQACSASLVRSAPPDRPLPRWFAQEPPAPGNPSEAQRPGWGLAHAKRALRKPLWPSCGAWLIHPSCQTSVLGFPPAASPSTRSWFPLDCAVLLCSTTLTFPH